MCGITVSSAKSTAHLEEGAQVLEEVSLGAPGVPLGQLQHGVGRQRAGNGPQAARPQQLHLQWEEGVQPPLELQAQAHLTAPLQPLQLLKVLRTRTSLMFQGSNQQRKTATQRSAKGLAQGHPGATLPLHQCSQYCNAQNDARGWRHTRLQRQLHGPGRSTSGGKSLVLKRFHQELSGNQKAQVRENVPGLRGCYRQIGERQPPSGMHRPAQRPASRADPARAIAVRVYHANVLHHVGLFPRDGYA